MPRLGSPSRQPAKREALNIRIPPQVLELIDRAARLAGKNRTDFELDAGRRAAEDTLLDGTVLSLSTKAICSFLRAWTPQHIQTNGY
jgi:uncharacterized protein (DUF1778 family)